MTPKYSIVLVNYSKPEMATYGILSWLLQESKVPYEVVLLHCTDYEEKIRELVDKHKPDNCDFKIYDINKPKYFNLAAFRNLGAYYAEGERLCFASVDIVRRRDFINQIDNSTDHNCWVSAGSFHIPIHTQYFKDIDYYSKKHTFDKAIIKVAAKNNLTHTLDYGTAFVNKEHFVNFGGYGDSLLFHEDVHIDMRANEYFKRRGSKHPIERTTDVTKYPGVKLKGRKRIDMHTHGMLIEHADKKAARKILKTVDKHEETLVFDKPLNLDESYLMERIYRHKCD